MTLQDDSTRSMNYIAALQLSHLKINDRNIGQHKSRGLGNLNMVSCIPLYFMIWRDYQNNWIKDGRCLSFDLSLKQTLNIHNFSFRDIQMNKKQELSRNYKKEELIYSDPSIQQTLNETITKSKSCERSLLN